MRLIAEFAFVLHARPWRETSLLVEILSAHHGRIGLIARGAQTPKRHPMRAALQPLQSIRFDAGIHGDLGQLHAVEAVDAAPRLSGAAILSGFYLNELTLRMTPRLDPLPQLYAAYARTRALLAWPELLAWTLRRYERDLLDALGIGFEWQRDGEGLPIDPAARYLLDPEYGARRQFNDADGGSRRMAATGAGLLALAADRMPEPEDLASLRLPMRWVLAQHLGSKGLKSWEILGDFGKLGDGT
ncbi:MAG: DNA repair protein RecO [Xanthomonadaceae bacterium]|jgi:DNA repair protein RecO (recombination protein O)|nr:DNA repair protein RecO [Xanthomonadaceae bacterium]